MGGVLRHGSGIDIATIAVGAETIIQRSRQFLNALFGVQETLLFGVRNEAHFRQHRGHARGAEHEETGLVHPFVLTPLGAVGRLDVPCKLNTLFHVAILHKFEDNVTLRSVGIKVLVDRSVVALLHDDTVLTFRHGQIFFSRVHTHRVGFCAERGGHSGWHRVGVDRNEEVGFVAVGNVRAPLEGDEHIGLASVHHLHVRAVVFHHPAESQSNLEVDILLFRDLARSTVVLPPVSRIDDEDKALTTPSRRRGSRGGGGETQQEEERHEEGCSSQTVNQHNNQFFLCEGRSRSARREHFMPPLMSKSTTKSAIRHCARAFICENGRLLHANCGLSVAKQEAYLVLNDVLCIVRRHSLLYIRPTSACARHCGNRKDGMPIRRFPDGLRPSARHGAARC